MAAMTAPRGAHLSQGGAVQAPVRATPAQGRYLQRGSLRERAIAGRLPNSLPGGTGAGRSMAGAGGLGGLRVNGLLWWHGNAKPLMTLQFYSLGTTRVAVAPTSAPVWRGVAPAIAFIEAFSVAARRTCRQRAT
jgi:hypothetical protein